QNGFNGSVSLTASGLLSGVTASFNPSNTTGTSTLTLTASPTAATGTATVTVTGSSSNLSSTTTISLTVNAPPSYTRSASPTSLTERLRLRSEEHMSELQSRGHLVCRLLLEKKKNNKQIGV